MLAQRPCPIRPGVGSRRSRGPHAPERRRPPPRDHYPASSRSPSEPALAHAAAPPQCVMPQTPQADGKRVRRHIDSIVRAAALEDDNSHGARIVSCAAVGASPATQTSSAAAKRTAFSKICRPSPTSGSTPLIFCRIQCGWLKGDR